MTVLNHKVRLCLTAAQEAYFRQACGTARFVWNWALAEWNRQHEDGGKPNWRAIKKAFNAIKYDVFPWMSDIHRDAHSRPFYNLGEGFKRFFRGEASKPTFKKKGKARDSFYMSNDQFRVAGNRIRIPRLGWVRMRENLRLTGKIMSGTVSRTADHWYVSIAVEGNFRRDRTADGAVGVDVGVKHAAVLSTGEKIEAPKPLAKALRRFRIRSRRFSRKAKGGKNRDRARRRLARLHERIANIRADFWHKLSDRLCRENQAVAVENLNVQGMVRNHRLARALADVGFGVFRPMLTYKAELYGGCLEVADRFYPSSRLCSVCGLVNGELTLKDREWICACGASHDRDVNAAQNLAGLIPGQALPG